MKAKTCPVNCEWETEVHHRGEANWRDCEITVKATTCIICGIRVRSYRKNKVQCSKGWWVCLRCLPNYCPREVPENPNPTIGKIVWVTQ